MNKIIESFIDVFMPFNWSPSIRKKKINKIKNKIKNGS